MALPDYPNNPAVGQTITLPSGIIMECTEAGTHPTWEAYDPRLEAEVIKQVSSVSELREKTGSFNGEAVQLVSYYAGANKGGGVLVWNSTSTAADDGGVTFAVTGVATGRWVRSLEGYVTPEMFGARGDGVSDDTPPFGYSLGYLSSVGGGNLTLLASTYSLRNSDDAWTHWDNKAAVKVISDNIHIKGAGIGLTILRLLDGADCHVVKFGDRITASPVFCTNCSISNLTIDGNRANQSLPTLTDDHWGGVDVAQGAIGVRVYDVHVKQTQYYGIGFQTRQFTDCSVSRVLIEDTGADGLDFKDDFGDSSGNKVSFVTVKRFGLVSSAILPEQAGVDLRGGVMASNIDVEQFSGDRRGIRFLVSATINKSFGSLTNFRVKPSARDTTRGLDIGSLSSSVKLMKISQGEVIGANIAVDVRSSYHRLSNVDARESDIGFQLYADNQLSNCMSNLCGTGYNVRNVRNSLVNCNAIANTVGANFESGSVLSSMLGGVFDQNTTNVTDSGTQTAIAKVNGIRTDTYVSGSFDVSTTGIKTIDIGHSLDFTPTIELTTVTINRVTSVNDYEIGFIRVNAVGSTQVNVSVFVKVASATPSATASAVIRCVAKKALRA